jgi:hypothetical protein
MRPSITVAVAFGRERVEQRLDGLFAIGRPGDDVGWLDLLLSQAIGDAADFLDRPADQLC